MEFKLNDDGQEQEQTDDRTPQIRYGQAAHEYNASLIQKAAAAETTATEQNTNEATIITPFPIASACWKTDADVEFENAQGISYITDDSFLFQCSPDYSVSMDAECILLHAQAEDDCVLYLQLSEPSQNDDGSEVMELTLTLETADDCQKLFDALSQLVSLHPVHDDDDDGGGAAAGMMMMMGMGNGHEENYGDDMVVAQREFQASSVTEEERDAMLDRLDTMLVVPPHLEQQDYGGGGQFDDAEDDVDGLL